MLTAVVGSARAVAALAARPAPWATLTGAPGSRAGASLHGRPGGTGCGRRHLPTAPEHRRWEPRTRPRHWAPGHRGDPLPRRRRARFRQRAQGGERALAQLYVRPLDPLQATPLSGTELRARLLSSRRTRARSAFSPAGKLKKIGSRRAAPLVTLCEAPDSRGGSWSRGRDASSSVRASSSGLARVSVDGRLTRSRSRGPIRPPESSRYRWPQALLGGKAVLFTALSVSAATIDDREHRRSRRLPRRSQEDRAAGRVPMPAILRSGHLVYVHGATLLRRTLRSRTSGAPGGAGARSWRELRL